MIFRSGIVFFCLSVLLAGPSVSYAQETEAYYHEDVDFRDGLDLFDKKQYTGAQQKFEAVIERINDPTDEIQINAEYHAAICALELFNRDADYRLRTFISDHPESPKVRIAYFQLGKYNYRRKFWNNAIEYFEQVDRLDLTTDEVEEYHFKLGYSYFEVGNYEEAKTNFYEIKGGDGDYANPALYYYSHLAYENSDYQAALQGFLDLEGDENFGLVVPFYIAQIYYLQGKYQNVIDYAPQLLENSDVKRSEEIARIIGESHYRLDQFEEAIPYLETYHAGNFALDREEIYQLGYAYYRSGEYEEANRHFDDVVDSKDYLSQISYYHMADCYLKLDEKQYARNAFKAAADLDFDEEVQEDALYSYAKLAYELSYNPYDEAIRAFEDYIDKYPNSPRLEEAYDYLLNVYMTTANYAGAIKSLDKLDKLDPKQQEAYQVVAFNHGVELYHDAQYAEAIETFKKVKTYPMDQNLSAQSLYWIAESTYRQGAYSQCITQYAEFMLEPGAFNLPEYNMANYNMAYAYMKQENFTAAITAFRKYANKYTAGDKTRLNDTYLRIGDCYFLENDITQAIDYYNKAVDLDLYNTDYALYQKAFCLGLKGKNEEKIETLEQVIADYPNSVLMVNIKFDLAGVYRVIDDRDNALKYYQQVINEFPNNMLVADALVQTGIIYGKNDEPPLAIATYDRVLDQYPNSSQAADALYQLKQLYIAQGNVNEFYSKYGNLADFSEAEQDSTNYESAINGFNNNGQCSGGQSYYVAYLQAYPNGIFVNQVNYELGECKRLAEKFDEALDYYQAILNNGNNLYTEDALYWASAIAFFELKDYQLALGYYSSLENFAGTGSRVLEAYVGQMRCFYRLKNYQSAAEYAESVLEDGTSETDILVKAHLILGMASMEIGDYNTALEELNYTSDHTKSEMGAEAKYNVAKIYYINGDYETSEDEVMELVQQKPSYDYWVASGYILLADVYLALGDTFQAKHTLQSIIDYYPGADLVKVAQDKLDAIIEAESRSTRAKINEEMEINLSGEENEELFEELPEKDKKDKNKDDKDAPPPNDVPDE